MEAKGKKLGPKTAALSGPCAGEDDLRGQAIAPNIQFSGGAIHGPDPIPEAREATGHYIKESTAVQGIKCVRYIKGHINPVRVLI